MITWTHTRCAARSSSEDAIQRSSPAGRMSRLSIGEYRDPRRRPNRRKYPAVTSADSSRLAAVLLRHAEHLREDAPRWTTPCVDSNGTHRRSSARDVFAAATMAVTYGCSRHIRAAPRWRPWRRPRRSRCGEALPPSLGRDSQVARRSGTIGHATTSSERAKWLRGFMDGSSIPIGCVIVLTRRSISADWSGHGAWWISP
jgi:hypothetical protein